MSSRRAQAAAVLVVVSVVVVPLATVVEGQLAGADAVEGDPSADLSPAFERDIVENVSQPPDKLRAHTEEYSAEGVKVGVVGSAFDPDHRAIRDDVADHRRLGPAGPFRTTDHDTAVADIVTRTAPGAELYLVGVGSTPTPERYAAAVEWLVDRDVDVVVDSGSYFPTVAGDGERVAAAAAAASEEGVVFVTSAGNYAGRHWAGEAATDGWVAFAPGDEANALADGERVRGRVSVRLRWNGTADYDLYLYRRLPGEDAVVASSTRRQTAPGKSVESIDVAVPDGRYYVAVHAREASDGPTAVQLFAAHNALEHTTERGSMVAPATSEQVITVGALAGDEPAPYSSSDEQGTTDVSGPGSVTTSVSGSLNGTSAAAPYVAGTAALMESGNDGLAPGQVEQILEDSSGDGGVDTAAAVSAAENQSRPDDEKRSTPTAEEERDSATDDTGGPSDDGREREDDGRERTDDGRERTDDGRERTDDEQRRDGGGPRDDGRERENGRTDDEQRRDGGGAHRSQSAENEPTGADRDRPTPRDQSDRRGRSAPATPHRVGADGVVVAG